MYGTLTIWIQFLENYILFTDCDVGSVFSCSMYMQRFVHFYRNQKNYIVKYALTMFETVD
jgi:hypothetical protein